MASKATPKKTTAKKAPKKLIEVFADEKVEQKKARGNLVEAIMNQDNVIATVEEEYVPKRLIVELWRRHENNRNFDVKVGQVVWSDVANDIILEGLRPDYAILLRTNLESNAIVGGPSRLDDPREWLRTLYKADVATDIYALEAKEIFDAS